MQIRTLVRLAIASAAGLALTGCVYEGEYGASAGYGGGYAYGGGANGRYYDDGFGGYAGGYYDDPAYYAGGYGWYNGFWYPGTGLFVYDRLGHGRRWSSGEQDYWSHHGEHGGTNGGRPGGVRPGGWQGGDPGRGNRGDRGHNPPPPYSNGGHWPPRGKAGGQWTPPPHRDGFVSGVGRAVSERHGRR